MKLKSFIYTLVIGFGAQVAAAAPTVSARLDSSSMLMGTLNTLRLEVVRNSAENGKFPLLEKFGPEGIIGLLNDTIELSRPKVDTVEVGNGRIQINYEVPLQVFDSGMYKLPDIYYVSGRDSIPAKGNLVLSVTPVKVSADDPISPMTDVAGPEGGSFLDSMPDWLYYYWWIILLGLALIGGGIFAWKRWRKEGSILPKRPEKTPYEQAIHDLKILKSRKLWESGREKEYYTDLTDILRTYLDGRFGIKAMEMTSKEIMEHLVDLGPGAVPKDKIRDILDMADFVKFAMVRPWPDDNMVVYDNALEFVESTKPTPEQEAGVKQPDVDGPSDKNTEEAVPDSPNPVEEYTSGINVGRRGRSARVDDSAAKISGSRMKVGKNIKKNKEGRP